MLLFSVLKEGLRVTFDCQLFSFKAERRRRLDSEIGFLATSYQIKETQNRLWCSLRACLQALSGSARPSLGQSWGALGRPWVDMQSYKTDLESFLSALGRAKALPIAIWTCPGAHFVMDVSNEITILKRRKREHQTLVGQF